MSPPFAIRHNTSPPVFRWRRRPTTVRGRQLDGRGGWRPPGADEGPQQAAGPQPQVGILGVGRRERAVGAGGLPAEEATGCRGRLGRSVCSWDATDVTGCRKPFWVTPLTVTYHVSKQAEFNFFFFCRSKHIKGSK